MCPKCFLSLPTGFVTRIWLSTYERLLYYDIFCLFQGLYMTGQVPVGHVQQFFQAVERGIFIYHKNRHNAQTYSVIKEFIYVIYESHLFVALKIHHAAVNDVKNSEAQNPEPKAIAR